jgi:hypothetical protein
MRMKSSSPISRTAAVNEAISNGSHRSIFVCSQLIQAIRRTRLATRSSEGSFADSVHVKQCFLTACAQEKDA